VLGPIRRRRHSDPDYDVPRPHGPLLRLLLPNGMHYHSGDNRQSGQESDAIEATRFFGEVDMSSSSAHSRYCVYYSYQGNSKTQGCNPNKYLFGGSWNCQNNQFSNIQCSAM